MSTSRTASRPHPLLGLLYLLFVGGVIAILAPPSYYLAIVPGLAIVALLTLTRYPQAGYYLVLFLIPFGALRAVSTPLGIVRLHWLIAVLLVAGLAFPHLTRKRIHANLKTALWPVLGLFTVVFVISSALSPHRSTAFYEFLLLVAAWIFIAISQVFVSDHGFRHTLPAVISWSVAVSALLAVLGYFFRVPGLTELLATGEAARSSGGSTDPNQLAVLILFAVPFIVHRLLYNRGTVTRMINAALLVVCLTALVATFSRSGAIILILIGLLLLLHHGRRLNPRRLGFVALGLPVAIVLLALTVPKDYWLRQRSVTDAADRSISRRASYLDVGYRAFKQRPLVGHGPGAFSEIYAVSEHTRRYTRNPDSYARDAHNTYLEVLVGCGALGLLLFLALLWQAMRSFMRARRQAEQQGATDLSSLIGTYQIAFVALLLFITVISNFFNKHLLLTLALSQVALRVSRPAPAVGPHEPEGSS